MRQISLDQCPSSVKIEDGKLFFGKNEVKFCDFVKPEERTVAQLYTVRVFNGQNWSLVTTLDLSQKMYWLCGFDMKWNKGSFGRESFPSGWYERIESIEKILNIFCADTAGKNWAFFEEEDFDAVDLSQDWPDNDELDEPFEQ